MVMVVTSTRRLYTTREPSVALALRSGRPGPSDRIQHEPDYQRPERPGQVHGGAVGAAPARRTPCAGARRPGRRGQVDGVLLRQQQHAQYSGHGGDGGTEWQAEGAFG